MNNKVSTIFRSAYMQKTKKWIRCPYCHDGRMAFDKSYDMWTCEDCNYQLSADEFREYENNTLFSNKKGICSKCGKILTDSDATLCDDCKKLRRGKIKKWVIGTGIAAAIGGIIYIAKRLSDDSDDVDYTPLPNDGEDVPDMDDEEMDVLESDGIGTARKYHVISAKRMGWEEIYDYFVYPADEFTKEEAQDQFRPVKGETLKDNNRWYEYTAYENQGTTYYKTIYDGIYDEEELINRGFTKEELEM